MANTRLKIYNDALLLLGERALNSLTEEREPRRLLDQVYNNDGIQDCLEEGQWFFAMRTVRLDYDTAVSPGYGYQYAFQKPTDWLITSSLCSDEYFNVPLTRYEDEAGYWYSDLQEIYVRYVSNDSGYGLNLARWPRKFSEFVAAHFAWKISNKVDADRTKEMFELRKKLLTEAKNNSLMAGPTRFPAQGSWSAARTSGNSRRDRGSRSSLIG